MEEERTGNPDIRQVTSKSPESVKYNMSGTEEERETGVFSLKGVQAVQTHIRHTATSLRWQTNRTRKMTQGSINTDKMPFCEEKK